MPLISPLGAGQALYTVTDSCGFVADLELDVNSFEQHFVNVTHPTGAAGLTLELIQPGPPIRTIALTGASGSSSAVPGRDVTWTATPAGATTVVNVTVTDVGGMGAVGQPWLLRGRVTTPAAWIVDVDAPYVTVTRLMCDPVAVLSGVPTIRVPEDTPFLATAALATVGTVAGGPMPPVVYRFLSTGDVALPPLPVCGTAQTRSLRSPMVYADASIDLQVQVAFDACGAIGTAWLRRTSATAQLQVAPRQQRVALVVDRSGSMWGDRWDNATRATRMLMQLFYAFRDGLTTEDQLGVVVFENSSCSWGAASRPPTGAILPLSRPADVDQAACSLAMGSPGSCTPIGDGLIAGMDLMVGGQADARYTLVLLTDGYENAGTVAVGAGAPAGVQRFGNARTQGPRAAVNSAMSLFTIGLGSFVDEPVLNNLPEISPGKGRYLKITDPSELAAAFGHILSFSQTAVPLTPTAVGGTEVRVTTAAGAERLGIAVLAPGGVVEVGHRPAGTSGSFLAGPASRSCPDVHAVAVTDVRALGVPGSIEWRVRHVVGGSPQPLAPSDVLAYEDLRVRADVVLDRPAYELGDSLGLTVHLREGGEPITAAKVSVFLDAPALGLGELLSKFGRRYQPPADVSGPDAPEGKALMIATVLDQLGWKEMPRTQPTGVFVDGTDELHDVDGTGDFRNVFTGLDHEGTYTWTVRAQGEDTQGHPFDRVLKVSTWAGVRVDRKVTTVTVNRLTGHPSGLLAAEVVVRPADAHGRLLGPFWDHAVVFAIENGVFEHVHDGTPAPLRYDGRYSRVVLFDREAPARVLISALGTRIGPIALTRIRRPVRPDLD